MPKIQEHAKNIPWLRKGNFFCFGYCTKSRKEFVSRLMFFYSTPFFYIKTSKFWPSLIVLKFLHNLSLDCSSAVLIFKSTHKNNNSKK